MFVLKTIPYLDQRYKCYKKIITINKQPDDELKNLISRINPPKLSPFVGNSCCEPPPQCLYAFNSLRNNCELMCIEELDELFMHIAELGYTVDNNFNKILLKNNNTKHDKNFLCFIKKC